MVSQIILAMAERSSRVEAQAVETIKELLLHWVITLVI
jgi:hypothetical protein